MTRARSSAFVLGAVLAVACAPAEDREDRCVRVQTQLDACAGAPIARLDCSAVSTADLDRLDDLGQGLACQALQGVAPTDGDPMSAACRLLGVGCVASVTPAPTRTPARYPVVLVNGIDTSPLFRYSPRIVSTMRDEGGHRVFLATLTPYETPQHRAPELWKRIDEIRSQTGAAKVNLVCHSLGGLDCRYLVSPNGLAADLGLAPNAIADAVASITTLGTAHRGTRVADVLLGLAADGDRAKVANDFATLAGDTFSPERIDGDVHLRDALRALSTASAPAFNAEIVDAPGVAYQSWAGYSRPLGTASAAHDALLTELCRTSDGESGLPIAGKHDFMALALVPFSDVAGKQLDDAAIVPNDGLATVASAKWGTFRGCIPADHMEQLGQHSLPDVNVRTGFDVARFYANVAGDLAAQGF
ncbi:MAG: Lipase precursor [Labilithrix sp.]|nr:Lipase precursor [Labilithrix sp.]